jgi:hypothetical protein
MENKGTEQMPEPSPTKKQRRLQSAKDREYVEPGIDDIRPSPREKVLGGSNIRFDRVVSRK